MFCLMIRNNIHPVMRHNYSNVLYEISLQVPLSNFTVPRLCPHLHHRPADPFPRTLAQSREQLTARHLGRLCFDWSLSV